MPQSTQALLLDNLDVVSLEIEVFLCRAAAAVKQGTPLHRLRNVVVRCSARVFVATCSCFRIMTEGSDCCMNLLTLLGLPGYGHFA